MQTEQVHQRHGYNSCSRSRDTSSGACRSLGFAQGPPVVYASIAPRSCQKRSLVRTLLQELKQIDPRCGVPTDGPLTLHKTVLGAPFLRCGKKSGPPLSFSRGAGRLWAAMCVKRKIGIDVAFPEEFTGSYPFARAFGIDELSLVKKFAQQDNLLAAALLWSLKEAAVKAVGTGFNRFDPLDVSVKRGQKRGSWIRFTVLAGRSISVWAQTERHGWLSLALL